MLTDLLATLAGWDFPLVVFAAGLAAAVESGLGVGMVFPGETAVLLLAAAATNPFRVAVLLLVVALAATAGDHVGYGLGVHYGARLRAGRVVRKAGIHHWDRATAAVRRHGAAAVVLTRLVPVVRTLAPAAAGACGLPYRRFLPASLGAGLLWSGMYVGLGAFGGASARYLDDVLGVVGWVVLGTAVVGFAAWVWRARRARVPAEVVSAEAVSVEAMPAERVPAEPERQGTWTT